MTEIFILESCPGYTQKRWESKEKKKSQRSKMWSNLQASGPREAATLVALQAFKAGLPPISPQTLLNEKERGI